MLHTATGHAGTLIMLLENTQIGKELRDLQVRAVMSCCIVVTGHAGAAHHAVGEHTEGQGAERPAGQGCQTFQSSLQS